MTKTANPIYDIVFKYLMSDSKIAKLILSKKKGEGAILRSKLKSSKP